MQSKKTSRLMNSPSTGWLFAFPAAFLMFLFIVVPFLLAFYFSFTNQRFSSPNAAEYVGLENFRQLLSVSVLTIEPERDPATNEILKEPDGFTQIPPRTLLHAQQPRLPAIQGHARMVFVEFR